MMVERERELPVDYGSENGRQMFCTIAAQYQPSDYYKSLEFISEKMTQARDGALGSLYPYSMSFGNGSQRFASTTRPRPLYNECINVKTEGVKMPYTYSCGIPGSKYVYWAPYTAHSEPSSTYRSFVLSGEGLGSSAWNAVGFARQRAWWNMQPRFEGRINLLNSIFELKDFRDITRHLMRFNYREMGEEMRSLKRLFNRVTKDMGLNDPTVGDIPRIVHNLDRTTRGLAALYLTHQFAIKPTYRDALAVHAQAAQCVDQMQQIFKKRGDLPTRAHYSESLFRDTPYLTTYTNYPYMELRGTSSAQFTASMEYLYAYRNRPTMRAFKHYWGLDLNAETVWNAVRLSFLWDYFIGIADSLRAMRPDPNVDLTESQYCESLLYKREAGWFTRKDKMYVHWAGVNGQLARHGVNGILFTGWRHSFYHRTVGEPARGPAIPKLHWPSLRQAVNLGALVRCWI